MKRGRVDNTCIPGVFVTVRTSLLVAALVGALGLSSGCGSTSLHETWKSTKKLYGEYLNPPASVDYEDKGSLSEAESLLASRMLPIDDQLVLLERFLENQDKPPTGAVIARLFGQFPWLSGLAAVDADGYVQAQEPPVPMKPLDFAPIVSEEARKTEPRGIRSYVQDTPLGPEVFVGVPIYQNAELRGVLVSHFDMRALLRYTVGAEDLVILSPQAVLWPGRFNIESTPLYGRKWEELTRSSVQGSVSNANGEFIWMVRFIGKTPIVFAAPVKGHFLENSDNASAILQSDSFGAPREQQSPVIESQVIEEPGKSLLLEPLPPVRDFGTEEKPISQ